MQPLEAVVASERDAATGHVVLVSNEPRLDALCGYQPRHFWAVISRVDWALNKKVVGDLCRECRRLVRAAATAGANPHD